MVFILGKDHADPFFDKLGPKITIFRGFTNFSEVLNCNISLKITKKQSGCGFRYKIWAKLVPILRKNERKSHYQLAIFSNFAWGTHSKGRSGG